MRGGSTALALLAERLEAGEAPSLEALAEAAAMSRFHFHRVFRLMTGETVNDVTRRLRLARGVTAARSTTVTEGAGEAAYATSQAFARAMRACTGMSVTEAVQRADLDTLLAPPRGGAPLAVELVSLAPIQVIAIRNVGDYAELDEVFGRLFELVGGPENVTGIYGRYHSDPASLPAEHCTFDAAVSVAEGLAPEGTQLQTFGDGRFLTLRYLGSYDRISSRSTRSPCGPWSTSGCAWPTRRRWRIISTIPRRWPKPSCAPICSCRSWSEADRLRQARALQPGPARAMDRLEARH